MKTGREGESWMEANWGVLLLQRFKWISRHVLWLPLFGLNSGEPRQKGET